MKKYIIILSFFIVAFIGLFATTKILDKHFTTAESVSGIIKDNGTSSEGSILNSMQGHGNAHELSEESTFVDNPEGNIADQTAISVTAKLTEEDWKIRQAAGLSNGKIALTMEESRGLYAYDNLTTEQRQLYAEILLIYREHVTNIPLSTNRVDEVEKISSCVLLDHPEIFYSDGYSYDQYMFADNVQKIAYSPNYTLTKEQIVDRNTLIDQAVESYLRGLPENATDYDKVKYIYETVILNTEYNLNATDNQNICSVFLGRESVCLGYAKAVQYLLQKVGVEATVVTGAVITGDAHAWNLVKVNGQYYYLDATWGDASYLTESGNGDALATINYDYLCITTQDILQTHTIDNPIPVPNCIVMLDNYYVKEGLYISSIDGMVMEKIFKEAEQNGRDCISIRCSGRMVFDDFRTNMLENQQIFNYLGSNTSSLAYTVNDKLYTYTFML